MQTGYIYAAAQLTIIAAAGDDPTYGLPGVGSHSRGYVSYESVDQFSLTAVTTLDVDLAQSQWASRAWTFQEGYLSRRRLFISHGYAIFACNRNIHWAGIQQPRRTRTKTKSGYAAGYRFGLSHMLKLQILFLVTACCELRFC